MIKTTTLIISFLVACISLFAQDVKKEQEKVKTKMDLFSSKTGTIIKFIDTKLPKWSSIYDHAETNIRRIINGASSVYFYQISKKETSAYIEYEDLLEILKALKALQSEVEKDIASNPDYLENQFVTVDGFQVGYYVSDGKANWYVKLDKYGSNNTLYFKSDVTIETVFTNAKNKIDELKK